MNRGASEGTPAHSTINALSDHDPVRAATPEEGIT